MSAGKIFYDGKMIRVRKGTVESLAPGIVPGKGVFETMRFSGGEIAFLENHLDRLMRGLRLMGFSSPYSRQRWRENLYGALKANRLKEARIRMMVWKERRERHAAIVCQKCRRADALSGRQGIRAVLSGVRRPKTRYAHIKSLDYLCFRRAYMEAKKNGYDEAILLNSRGEVTEGSRTNVFFVKGKNIFTPAVRCGCLNGITRQIVIRAARRMGVPCRAVSMDWKRMLRADEAFVTNSVMGVMPLMAINGRRVGTGKAGPLTGKLRKSYFDALRSAGSGRAF